MKVNMHESIMCKVIKSRNITTYAVSAIYRIEKIGSQAPKLRVSPAYDCTRPF